MPPVLIPDLKSVQVPAVCEPSARVAEDSRLPGGQAGPASFVGRAGLRSGVKPANNIVVSGAAGSSRIQDPGSGSRFHKEVDSCGLVLRAASEMSNPGILEVLRSPLRVHPGAGSAPGPPGQSRIQAGAGLAGSSRQGSEGAAGSPGRGGLRQAGVQDRSVTRNVPDVLPVNVPGELPVDLPAVMPVDVPAKLVPDISVQGDAVSVGPRQGGSGETAEVVLAVLLRGNRVKSQVIPYQAGESGMG